MGGGGVGGWGWGCMGEIGWVQGGRLVCALGWGGSSFGVHHGMGVEGERNSTLGCGWGNKVVLCVTLPAWFFFFFWGGGLFVEPNMGGYECWGI